MGLELTWKTVTFLGALLLVTNALFVAPDYHSSSEEDCIFDQLAHTNASCNAAAESDSFIDTLDRTGQAAFKFGRANRWYILALLLAVPLSTNLYSYFFEPLSVSKTMEEVEAKLEGKKYRGRRPRRSKGQLPPPYPNSWFKVMNSHELQRGEVKDIEMLGQHFVVFRGKDDGKVRILDAYCPHMGANLGVGGTVDGDEIVCPFHGWQFNGDGKCTKIPYADAVPSLPNAVKTWTTTEINNAIYVWHDAEGREPQWMVPEIKGITDGTWYFHGESTHQVRAHIQEIPENGADTAHLNWLHVPFVIEIPIFDVFFTHTWGATWEEGKGIDSHLAHIKLEHAIKLMGWEIPGSRMEVHITQVGPSTVHLNFLSPVGKVLVIETVTPVQPLLQRATHQAFGEWRVPRFAAKFILRGLISQFEKDVPIWNNKTFVRAPMVVKQDGPISKYRRWFQKNFYSENSERIAREREEAIAGSLDW